MEIVKSGVNSQHNGEKVYLKQCVLISYIFNSCPEFNEVFFTNTIIKNKQLISCTMVFAEFKTGETYAHIQKTFLRRYC